MPLAAKKEIAEGVIEMSLKKTSDFSFDAGQYVRLYLPQNGFHDFSLSSSPSDTSQIAFAFHPSESGYKKELLSIEIGKEIDVEGPFGFFTLPKEMKAPLIWIAGGIGITPFRSMAHFIAEKKLPYEVHLHYSFSKESAAAYLEEMQHFSEIVSSFTLHQVHEHIDNAYMRNHYIENGLYYVCGPPKMVVETRGVLLSLNIPETQIRIEEFTGYA